MGPWFVPPAVEALVLLIVWASVRRVMSERTGRRTVLLAALAYSLRLYDTPSINPDFYASIFELGAVAIWLSALLAERDEEWQSKSSKSAARRAYFEAGLFWAAATSIKQVGCVGLLILTLISLPWAIALRTWAVPWRRSLAWVWSGFAAGVAVVIVVLVAKGTWREAWYAVFTFNTGLLDLAGLKASALRLLEVRRELLPVALPLWLGMVGFIMSFWYRRIGGFPFSLAIGLVLWWAAAAVLAERGPSGSMRYWQASFPPMLMLAAVGLFYIQGAQDQLDRPERLTFFILAASCAVLLMRPAAYELRAGLASSYVAYGEHPTERERLTEIGGKVKALAPPGRSVYVLGYDPGIYVYSDRPAASRFTYPRSAQQMSEILDAVESENTTVMVMPKHPSGHFTKWCDQECRGRIAAKLQSCSIRESTADYDILTCLGK